MTNPRQSAFVPFIESLIRYHEQVERVLTQLLTQTLQFQEPDTIRALQREQFENQRVLAQLRALTPPILVRARTQPDDDGIDDESDDGQDGDDARIRTISSPRNFIATPGDNQVALSWEAPERGTPQQYLITVVHVRDPTGNEVNRPYELSVSANVTAITLAHEHHPIIEAGAVFIFRLLARGDGEERSAEVVTGEVTIEGQRQSPSPGPVTPPGPTSPGSGLQQLGVVENLGYELGNDFVHLAWNPVTNASAYLLQIIWTNGPGAPHYREILTRTEVLYARETNAWVQHGANVTFVINAVTNNVLYANGPETILNVVIRRGRASRPALPPHVPDTVGPTPPHDSLTPPGSTPPDSEMPGPMLQQLGVVENLGYDYGNDFVHVAWSSVEHASAYLLRIIWNDAPTGARRDWQEIIEGTEVVYASEWYSWVRQGAHVTFIINAVTNNGSYANGPETILNAVIQRGKASRPALPPHVPDTVGPAPSSERDLDFLIDTHSQRPALPPNPHDLSARPDRLLPSSSGSALVRQELDDGPDAVQNGLRELEEGQQRLMRALEAPDPTEELLRRLGPPARQLPEQRNLPVLARDTDALLALVHHDPLARLLEDVIRRLNDLPGSLDAVHAVLNRPQNLLPAPVVRALLPEHASSSASLLPYHRGDLQIPPASVERLRQVYARFRDHLREIENLRQVANTEFRDDCGDYLHKFMNYRIQMEKAIKGLQGAFLQAGLISPQLLHQQVAAALSRIEFLYNYETITKKDTQKKMRQLEAQVLGPLAREMQALRQELRMLIKEAARLRSEGVVEL